MKGDTAGTQPVLAEPEYDAIEQAVMETERGRWFLREFARRHRYAETERLLDAIARLEETIAARPAVEVAAAPTEETGVKRAIREMSAEIAKTKREIASIRPQGTDHGDISDATAELDAIVASTEGATSDILGAAEQIQELAWTLREEGVADSYCEALDQRATEIYTACSFQDITGQRTSKVVKVLQFLEARINTMAELWGGAVDVGPTPQDTFDEPEDSDQALLNGPALEGEGIDQDEVDRMLLDFSDAPDEPSDGTVDLTSSDTAEPLDSFDTVIDSESVDSLEPVTGTDSATGANPIDQEPDAEALADDVTLVDNSSDEIAVAALAEASIDQISPNGQGGSVDATMEADFATVEDDAAPATEEQLAELSQKDLDALFA